MTTDYSPIQILDSLAENLLKNLFDLLVFDNETLEEYLFIYSYENAYISGGAKEYFTRHFQTVLNIHNVICEDQNAATGAALFFQYLHK